MMRRVSVFLRSTLGQLSSWLKNTVRNCSQAVYEFNYWAALRAVMYALRARWLGLVNRLPSRRKLAEYERAYWFEHDERDRIDAEYRLLYGKYLDLVDEVKYWETRHARVLNFIEKQMDETK